MPRKVRNSNEICGDCGATDPSWASINRGILLCGECCSIHRTLGRHVSQIKSLYQSSWCPTLKQMLYAMLDHNVNGIMEHLLLDPSAKATRVKKPQPNDNLHPTKAEFIRAKHLQLAYILRSCQENCPEDDLSKQLHASVRSPNLETSVRLLIQGADPNYLHEDKKTTPLHAAVRAGQINQVELLIIYGANPTAPDGQGYTPQDVAVNLGHKQIEQRLIECSYEVTDRLLYYLCKKKPDHSKGQHYIGTEKLNKVITPDYGSNSARGRLQMLPNHLFEELVQDMYDEIDRREIEAIWQSTYSQLSEFNDKFPGIPFLPVDYSLSTTRNQGRQKLARFSHSEFCALVFDVLMNIKQRHHEEISSDRETTIAIPLNFSSKASQLSDDEPIYDSVASDDESAAFSTLQKSKQTSSSLPASPTHRLQISTEEVQLDNLNNSTQQEIDDEKDLAEKLAFAESKIIELNSLVEHLTTENSQLKLRSSSLSTDNVLNLNSSNQLSSPNKSKMDLSNVNTSISSTVNLNNFVMSGDGLNLNLNTSALLMDGINLLNLNLNNANVTSLSSTNNTMKENFDSSNLNMHLIDVTGENDKSGIKPPCILEECGENNNAYDGRIMKGVQQRPKSMYETREGIKSNANKNTLYNYTQNANNQRDGRNQVTCSMYQCKSNNLIDKENATKDHTLTIFPISEEVMRRTDQVTKRIQELWNCIQGDKRDGFVPCAERIRIAVAELSAIFPHVIPEEDVRHSLRNLNNNTNLLQEQCALLLKIMNENSQTGLWEHYLHEVRYLAYEIAKATKQLVTIFQQDEIQ